MKRLVLSLMIVCMFAPMIFAEGWDTALSAPQRRAAHLTLLNSNCDWFNLGYLQNIMVAMQQWANRSNPSDGWWGGTDPFATGYMGNQTDFNNAIGALNYWLANPAGMETWAMSEGHDAYMTNGTQGQQSNLADDMLHQDEQYAYAADLTVTSQVSLGYYFGRGETSWATEHSGDMVRFVTGGTEFTFYANASHTPIVLDMNGDGTLEASNGEWLPHEMVVKEKEKLVAFDVNADGFDELTEWVGPNDGLLVEYESGAITAKNLFGSEGGKYRDGFEKLALLDKNGDKKLAGDELKTLKVWLDKNGNAKVDDGEISTVESLGITEISVEHKNLVSSFVKDAKTHVMWDWNPATAMVKKEEPK